MAAMVCIVGMCVGLLLGFIFGEMYYYSLHKDMYRTVLANADKTIASKNEQIKFLQSELAWERRSNIDISIEEDLNNESNSTQSRDINSDTLSRGTRTSVN